MADLAFIPVQDQIQSTTYRIYDGACGTGGMLTVGEQRIRELAEKSGKKVSIKLYGQENADETYAIARADMLVKGEGSQADNIFFGSTISNDGFPREEFDFMLSNPPFGTSWKAELKAWGDIKKDDITDPRFIINYDGNPNYSLLPDIGDPQMLFLANNISKMKTSTTLGSRIVEVHNGSSLFGKAGSGPSNLRRYIIENDLLEAIVALPENMFYNTGIGTFLWIVTNKKAEERKGKVQLIDATTLKSPLRKNLGDKNCELTPEIREKIMELYLDFTKADETYSKVFDNEEFGFYSVDILRPLRLRVTITEDNLQALKIETKDDALYNLMKQMRNSISDTTFMDYNAFFSELESIADEINVKLTAKRVKNIRSYFTTVDENAEPVKDKKGGYESDKDLKDTELIPFTYEGGIEAFFNNEVLPYAKDAWIDKNSIVIGYEINFTKYFFTPAELRSVEDIIADIQSIEFDTDGLLASIIGGITNAKI